MLRILLVSLLMYSCWAETLETDTENLATDKPDADRMLLPSGRTPRIRLIVMLMSSRAWQWETSDQQRFSDQERKHSSILHHTLEERYQHLT